MLQLQIPNRQAEDRILGKASLILMNTEGMTESSAVPPDRIPATPYQRRCEWIDWDKDLTLATSDLLKPR